MATGVARERCESCGATLHGELPAGFCPACLLTTAIEEVEPEEQVRGSRIQDYELLNEVAHGGMGIVYRARQRVPPRIVALKMILPANVGSAEAMTRFRAEAEAAASLEHEGILPIYAVGEHDGAPFYSMKFAEGGTLSAQIENYRDKPREAAALVAKLARAVAFAHEHRILHRDLKPGNILFDSAGKPYVSDFGLAKWLARESDITQTFAVLGTPFYMAPEQAVSSHMVTASADVYSLGAILYHLLTGHPPLTGETPMEVLRRAAEQLPQRPRLTNRSVPPDLETICLKCLEKDPAWRYSSASALADDLDRFCARRTILARRTGVFTRGKKWVRRNPTSALLAASLVALFVVIGWNIWKGELVRQPGAMSIAVLPFENLGEATGNAFLAEGIQDEILTRLSKIAGLKVISHTSTQHFKSSPKNLPDIARQLGVANILEGSVQEGGDQVRVNVQLINAASDAHLWAETYDRKLTDIFAVESDIAKTVANTLQAKLTGSEQSSIAKAPTNNTEAYQLYLKGRFFWNKRTASGLRKSIEYFNQAIEKDPNYAVAYAAIAQSWVLLPAYGGGAPKDCFPQAEAAAKKALQLDNTSAEAYAALGSVKWLYQFDLRGALENYGRAIQLNPNDATAHHWLGTHPLNACGQRERAIAEIKRALELDPISLITNTVLGYVFLLQGRADDAVAQLRKALDMDSSFYFARLNLGIALELKGMFPDALAEYQKAISFNDDPIAVALLGHLYGKLGRRDETLGIIQRLAELEKQKWVSPYGFAMLYLGLGDREQALDRLEQSYRERDGYNIELIRVDPFLMPLHGEPRFEALAEKIVPAREFGGSAK